MNRRSVSAFRQLFQHLRRVTITASSSRIRRIGVGSATSVGVLPALFGIFSSNEKTQDEQLELMIKRAILVFQEGEDKKAEQILHVALKLAQEMQNHDGITFIFDTLANIAYETHQYRKAERIFKDLIGRLLGNGVPPDHNKIVHISAKLASLYGLLDQNEKAEQGFQFCIDSQTKKLDKGISDDDTILLTGLCLDWYARFLMAEKRFNLARKSFQKAYELSCQVNGSSHEQSLVLLNDIASVNAMEGDFSGAESKLLSAIEMGEKLDTEFVSAFYVNLGSVYMQKGLYEKAKEACDKGGISARKFKNEEAVDEANICLEELKKAMA